MTKTIGSELPYGADPPRSWDVVPLKYLASLTNGYVFNSDSWAGSGTPIIRIENLNGSEHFNYSSLDLSHRFRVHQGDLLFSWSGNPGTSFGPFRWSRTGTYYLNQHIFNLSVAGCNRDWMYWALKAATHWIERELTSGMIGMVHVTKEELENVPIPVPPVAEQRRIARFLDAETARIDSLRDLRTRQIRLLNERLESIWSSVVARDGAGANWVPIRRFVAAITDGPFGSALTSAHYSDSGARVIRLGNLGRAEFRERDAAYIPLEYFAELQRHEALAGDLVVAGLGDQKNPLGRACVVPEGIGPAMVKADCFRVRLDQSRMLHEYAAWALSSPPVSDRIALLARGSTRARINLEVVREITVPVPPLSQQQRSVDILTKERAAVRTVSQRCGRQLNLLAERRQALITAAVTGQFDVSAASGRNVTDGVTP